MAEGLSDGRYSWLDASAVRNASDIVLGVVVLAAAAAAILGSRGLSFDEMGSGFFPAIIGALLALVGVLLLTRGALRRAPHIRWKGRHVLLVAMFCAAICVAVTLVGLLPQITLVSVLGRLPLDGWLGGAANILLIFGPLDWAALYLLSLSVAVALARLSRLRAAGMLLLGLLLQIVGIDRPTGELRLTMGLEQLFGGIDLLVLAPALILVADSLVCLFSPRLLLATYTRRIDGWRDPDVSTIAAIGMRVAAVLVLASSCYLAFKVSHRVLDIGVLLLFGAFGVACKIFGWNRLVLLLAFVYGEPIEEAIRMAMMLWGGDPTFVFRQPIGSTLLAAAACILMLAVVLSLRRMQSRNASGATAA